MFSISSSTGGIETLEIKITWNDDGCRKDLVSSEAGWSKLDEVLTGERFVSLRTVILDFSLKMMAGCDDYHHRNLEYKKLYANVLLPMFKILTSRQCTLETYGEVC
jgi:hypothetical protein